MFFKFFFSYCFKCLLFAPMAVMGPAMLNYQTGFASGTNNGTPKPAVTGGKFSNASKNKKTGYRRTRGYYGQVFFTPAMFYLIKTSREK